MAITQFPDSPRAGAWGDRPYTIIDFAGPASYAAITPGVAPAAPTGGQPIGPSNFGMGSNIEGIFMVGCSTTGTYGVEAVQLTSYNQGSGNTTWALLWYVLATGAQVAGAVNLSAETVRLIGFGPY